MTPLAVFAAGNDVRGDDALGPLLAARLAAIRIPGLVIHQDFQFQVEHALDLPADGLALFIDAHCDQLEPVRLTEVAPGADCGAGTHALDPAQVLAVARRIGRPLPSCWLLSLRGRAFGLGQPLSASGRLVLAAGWGLLGALVRRPSAAAWRAWASSPCPPAN